MREWHDWYAAVNEKWGLERGDDIHETGASHKSLEEHNRELHRENKSLEEELETKRRAVKRLTTMIENLTRRQDDILRWKDVLSTGLRVFIAGIDGATGVAQVSGGGGTSNDMPWRDKDEDLQDYARRVMLFDHAMCYSGSRHKRTQNR